MHNNLKKIIIIRPLHSDDLISSSDGATRFIALYYFIQTANILWTIIKKKTQTIA